MLSSTQLRLGVFALLLTLVSYASAAPSLALVRRRTIIYPSKPAPKLVGGRTNLFTFGDSYTNTGFAAAGALPSVENPFGNPPAPPRNWVAALTTVYNSSLTYSFNYAMGGATINKSIVSSSPIRSLQEQVENTFLPIEGAKANGSDWDWTASNAVAGFFIGINDVNRCLTDPKCDFKETNVELQASYLNILEKVYKSGVRNFFFLNLPPLERAPRVADTDEATIEKYKQSTDLYNAALAKTFAHFQSIHPDSTTLEFDNHQCWLDIISQGPRYGFNDPTKIGDYSDPRFLWSDNFHPGHSMHFAVAAILAARLYETFGF